MTAGRGLGDDEACPAVLERMLKAAGLPFSVKNHGMSGDTSADAVRRLDAALAESPAITIVALGANTPWRFTGSSRRSRKSTTCRSCRFC